MAQLSLADRANTRVYGLLSGRISDILAAEERDLLTAAERSELVNGVELLRRCVAGSELVEGKLQKGATPPSTQSIRDLGYALSTLEVLGDLSKMNEASSVLGALAEDLQRITEGDKPRRPTSVQELRRFFSLLALEFLRDLANHENRGSTPGRFLRAEFE